MRSKCFLAAAFGLITMIVSVRAQAPQASRERAWRGVGPQPCMGPPKEILTPAMLEELYAAPSRYYRHQEHAEDVPKRR